MYHYNTMFKLRTKPTQFTAGKTEDTLCDLTQRYLLNNSGDEEHHLIDIIVTNKSLPETEQWKCRTDRKFNNMKDITIDILSSKSDDYKNINEYISNILTAKTKDDLPNILIICYHEKRVCVDLIKLFATFGGENYVQITTKLKFHISFDEPDANIGVTKKFIKKVKRFIDQNLIIGILFVTATPVDEFWKMLSQSGIVKLLNMNHNNTQNFDEELQNYRSFKEHNIITYPNNTNNPLEYIIKAFAAVDENKNKLIDESVRKIVFAPAHLFTDASGVGSHCEVKHYFLGKGYCVFLMNGKFKGFVYPDGTELELSAFNAEHNINDELRVSLARWNELNPTMNIAITGYWVIERGITFNTIGFNFTDMILSNYHLKCLHKLIQLAGRASGGKIYVHCMNVICTPEVKAAIVAFNANLEEICRLNPEHFNRTDFVNTDNTIPVKMIIDDEQIRNRIFEIRGDKEKGVRGYKQAIHHVLIDGIANGRITIIDRNNIRKFDITKRSLKDFRYYKLGDKIDVRRFKNFNSAFENYKNVSQTGKIDQYSVDFAKDTYVYGDGFVNNVDTAWITYTVTE
jgi:hypothetical protein